MERNVWRKSSRSGNNGQCVEVRHQDHGVDVRDSKHPNDAMLSVTWPEWRAFVEGVQQGEFEE